MPITTDEARREILDELGAATDQLAVALAALGDAFELLPDATAERLEDSIYRPIQRAFGRGQRTHSGFAERVGLPARQFEMPGPGAASQGVKAFIEKAVGAAALADHRIAELQDSLLPVESGDAELRAGLGEMRELLAPVSAAARDLVRTLGR